MAGKSNLNFLIIILVILVIDVVGGYFIGKKLLVPMTYERQDEIMGETAEESESEEGAVVSEEPTLTEPLDAINLNPRGSDGEIFSCTLTIGYYDDKLVEELKLRNTQIIDILLDYLSAKTILELNDVDNRDDYRKEMINKVNSILTKGQISNLYVSQWIIQ